MDERYKRGKIYKLVSSQTDKIYIGSTIQLLCQRKAKHKYTKQHKTIKDITCFNDWDIVLIKNFPCNNRKELLKEEGICIKENYSICINKQIAGRTYIEYMEQEGIEINKKYKIKNRVKILKYKQNQKWYCEICDKHMSRGNKNRHEKTKLHLSNTARNFLL